MKREGWPFSYFISHKNLYISPEAYWKRLSRNMQLTIFLQLSLFKFCEMLRLFNVCNVIAKSTWYFVREVWFGTLSELWITLLLIYVICYYVLLYKVFIIYYMAKDS